MSQEPTAKQYEAEVMAECERDSAEYDNADNDVEEGMGQDE